MRLISEDSAVLVYRDEVGHLGRGRIRVREVRAELRDRHHVMPRYWYTNNDVIHLDFRSDGGRMPLVWQFSPYNGRRLSNYLDLWAGWAQQDVNQPVRPRLRGAGGNDAPASLEIGREQWHRWFAEEQCLRFQCRFERGFQVYRTGCGRRSYNCIRAVDYMPGSTAVFQLHSQSGHHPIRLEGQPAQFLQLWTAIRDLVIPLEQEVEDREYTKNLRYAIKRFQSGPISTTYPPEERWISICQMYGLRPTERMPDAVLSGTDRER